MDHVLYSTGFGHERTISWFGVVARQTYDDGSRYLIVTAHEQDIPRRTRIHDRTRMQHLAQQFSLGSPANSD